MVENFPDLWKEIDNKVQDLQRASNNKTQRGLHQDT